MLPKCIHVVGCIFRFFFLVCAHFVLPVYGRINFFDLLVPTRMSYTENIFFFYLILKLKKKKKHLPKDFEAMKFQKAFSSHVLNKEHLFF